MASVCVSSSEAQGGMDTKNIKKVQTIHILHGWQMLLITDV